MNQIRNTNMLTDLEQSMNIYTKLRSVNPFYPGDIARLLQTLHTSVRIARRDANKYKSQKKDNSDAIEKIKEYFLIIAEDMRNGVVQASFWGVIHLYTAFATMEIPQEGLNLWSALSDSKNSKCSKLMWSPVIIGSVIDLMTAVDAPFENIKQVYETSKATGGEASNIEQAMIGALIKNNMIGDALQLFTTMLKVYPDETYSLVRIHDRFVGDCDDIPTALRFFYEGIQKKTPYQATTHPSTVVRLMQRIWATENEPDFDLLENVWKSYIASTSPSMGEWMFNSTVNFYLKAFMEHYPEPTPEAVSRLKEVIQFYIKTRVNISPIFLNTVLSAVKPWADRDIVFTIISAFQIYHLPEDFVSCRIILNSLENIDVEQDYIISRWNKLVDAQKNSRNNNNQPVIQQLDLLALLRACYRPERELLFTSIFEDLLNRGQLTQKVIYEMKQSLHNNPRYSSKQEYFDKLLKKNFIEFKTNGVMEKHVPFN